MDSVNWTDRKQVRELVQKHGLIFRQAAENGIIEQAQLDVGDELNAITESLDESKVELFNNLYAEESNAAASKLERETAELNLKTAEIELKTAESNAKAEYTGQIIGAIILFVVLFFVFKNL